MGVKRPNKQLKLTFAEDAAGEARPLAAQEVERSTAAGETERPVKSVTEMMEAMSLSNRIGHITDRTAVYGPVRTVAWEGPGRKARPYPDRGQSPRFAASASPEP